MHARGHDGRADVCHSHWRLVELREGLYADLHDEILAQEKAALAALAEGARGGGVLSSILKGGDAHDDHGAGGRRRSQGGGRRRASQLMKPK